MNKTYNIFQTHFTWCISHFVGGSFTVIYTLWHHKLNVVPVHFALPFYLLEHWNCFRYATSFSTTMPNFWISEYQCFCFTAETPAVDPLVVGIARDTHIRMSMWSRFCVIWSEILRNESNGNSNKHRSENRVKRHTESQKVI